jgi:hypothetical protein
MMINAEIIAQNLAKSMDVRLMGLPSKALKLKRVKLYESGRELKAGSVYVADISIPDELPIIAEDSLLVCVGGLFVSGAFGSANKAENSNARAGKGALLLVDGSSGYLAVFNAIQDIFERYIEWDESLREILNGSGGIKEMVDVSVPIFENPIGVIDQELRVVVATDILPSVGEGQKPRYSLRTKAGLPVTEPAGVIRRIHAQNYTRRKPFLFVDKKLRCYCINLYVNNCYSGMLGLGNEYRPQTDADLVLFEYFSGLVLAAYRKLTTITGCKIVDLRNVFRSLMNGEVVSEIKVNRALTSSGQPDQFICISIRPTADSSNIPAEYFCAQLENLLPGSIVIPHESAIAGILSLNNCPRGVDGALSLLDEFLEELDFRAGVSNSFADLQNVKSYFTQARCAIEIGSEVGWKEEERGKGVGGGGRHFLFRDYALPYIITQAQKELAPRFLVPPGLLRLKAHDSRASSEYWRTLRVYLDSSMNVTLTAKKLYLHRRSLYQRLRRIEKLLELDLKDPYDRLYLLFGIGVIEQSERTGPQ